MTERRGSQAKQHPSTRPDVPPANPALTPPLVGSDVVDWLFHHVEGFSDRREARKYASNLLKAGYIRHTVNKITFSEQCYYIFGDFSDCENCEWAAGPGRGVGLGPHGPRLLGVEALECLPVGSL